MRSTGYTSLVAELARRLSPSRVAHSLRVAEAAREIARSAGLDPEKAYLAGLLHDIAKELPPEELAALAPPENEVERAHPLVLHGRAGRELARELGVTDPEVLEAIEGHVVGVPAGSALGMAVYLADLAEPGRGFNQDLLERALAGDLEGAYREALRRKMEYLRQRGIPLHPRTLKLAEELGVAPTD